MDKIRFLLSIIAAGYLSSCSRSPAEEAQSSVQNYIGENLKRMEQYEPISFSSIDTLAQADTTGTNQISLYRITHIYSLTRSDRKKGNMTVSFYLDKDFRVTGKIMILRKY